ncbi:MAG: A/G-specific adenine glycosylase [Lachnospiraceae bacterium]|nr:A/G-specific adenine glycosylase [Lachnospiraceae bacterium]
MTNSNTHTDEKKLDSSIVPALLNWYDHNARILPWRSEPSPYRVWISEIMLQQTRVEAVKPYYDRFMEALPDVKALAEVEEEKLLKLWEGLGYYNRARNLKRAAETVMEEFGGKIPENYEGLLSLKGIGEYTAGAIASIALKIPVPAVDGNVMRVVARLLACGDDVLKVSTKRWMTKAVASIIPKERPGDFNQALMELGAVVCLPNGAPLCEKCPWDTVCKAHYQDREQEFPYKQPKKSRKIQKKAVYLLEYENRFALRKRPESGLLAGLWEFPTFDCGQQGDNVDKILDNSVESSENVDKIGTGKHIFSHIEWHMTGYYILLQKKLKSDSLIWVTKEELEQEYAVPSAFAFMKDFLYKQ